MSVKTFKGKIVSTKMQKTVVVAVDMPKRHPIYDKIVKRTKRLKARDEVGVTLGDAVVIEECKPYSKDVSFKVTSKILAKGKEK